MKKLIMLVLVSILALTLGGCKKETKVTFLSGQDIFTQGGTYFVVFYRDDCPDCESVKPLVITYLELLRDEPKEYEGKSTIYAVNLSDPANEGIYRTYSEARKGWGPGQGDSGTFWVDGVEDFDMLYIGETAALISIGTTLEGATKATFQAAGYDAIYARLTEHLGLEQQEQQQYQ
ncbi:MAG: hypothetical protein PHY42_00265 [Bacilli bacterium]|nr:hypothetical protein [Bacilli bacterium]